MNIRKVLEKIDMGVFRFFEEVVFPQGVGMMCLFFVFWSNFFAAQKVVTEETINKQFDTALHYVTSDNPEKAIPILNEINNNCKKIGYKSGIARVGNALAIIYFNSSDYNKVINLSDDFLKAADEVQDYGRMSQIYRLKGCAYSELGLLKKGDQEYSLALHYAEKINPGNPKYYALSVIYGNLASHLIRSGTPWNSVYANINKSIAEAKKISETQEDYISKKYSLIAYSYIILANEYFKSGDQERAGEYYLKALKIHESKPVPLVEKVVLVSELGSFYNSRKEYDKAVEYAEYGLALEKKASFPQLRKGLFETLSKSYLELHETEKSRKYLEMFTALNDSISNIDRKTLSNTVSKQEQEYNDSISRRTYAYALLSLILIACGTAYFLYYKKKKQGQIQKIENLLKQLKEQKDEPARFADTGSNQDSLINKEEDIAIMPPEAEEKLLEKLHDFEKQRLYLERKVSLPYVASKIETNTKYLSYIIKKHKEKDFNKYINDLRIDYIIRKISEDPAYRQYKINVLAEETGFSSHSKFATVFKANVGISPSEFIRYVNKKGN